MRVFLPYPPSANERLTVRKGGKGFVNTARYRTWKEEAAWLVSMAAKNLGKVSGHYTLDMVVMPPILKRSRDLDNLLKATSDALKDGGAIEDDSLCQMIRIAWGELDGPGVFCAVHKCPSPLSPEDGKDKPPSGTAKSQTRLRTHRSATIRDAKAGEYMDMGARAWLGLGDRPSSTPAESTASKKPKT